MLLPGPGRGWERAGEGAAPCPLSWVMLPALLHGEQERRAEPCGEGMNPKPTCSHENRLQPGWDFGRGKFFVELIPDWDLRCEPALAYAVFQPGVRNRVSTYSVFRSRWLRFKAGSTPAFLPDLW